MRKRLLHILLFLLAFVCVDRLIGWGLNVGLNRYFGLTQHSEVLFVGHSHLMLAVDKEGFEQGTATEVSKYCREGVNVADRLEMVRQFLASPYSDSLKVVIYGVDQFMFTGEGLSMNSYKLFYPFMDEPHIDHYIRRSTDLYDYLTHKSICSLRYSDALLNSSIRGWAGNWENYKIGKLDVIALEKQVAQNAQRHIKFELALIESFEQTLRLLTSKGITVILVNTPIAKPLNGYEPELYSRFIQYMQRKDASSTHIIYWDLNPAFSDHYDLFFDPIHLNVEGQRVINEELVKRFNAIKHQL